MADCIPISVGIPVESRLFPFSCTSLV